MSRQDKIRAAKRNQFQQRQQVNQLYAQRVREGMTPAQAATSPYVVKDTDTLESLSGDNPDAFLAANPELKNVQTGMVINAPGSDAWRAQNIYNRPTGMGLPSNGPIGAAQGPLSPFQEEKQISTQDAFRAAYNSATPPGAPSNNWMSPSTPTSGQTWIQKAASMAGTGQRAPYPLYAQNIQATQSAPTPLAPQPVQPARPAAVPTTYPGGFRRWVGEEMAQINNPDYTPNPQTLKYLEKLGLIKKSKPQTAFSGGFGGYNRRRGGGGGGRGRSTGGGGVQQGDRMPAFSSGAGNMGLINWRI
jgi:hypothetical protein